jgi:probable HAF family extracellular repeat protein
VLWDHGAVTDIGAGVLPAPFWNTPMAINEHGDVVGFAGDPSDDTGGITHAFLWTRAGGMQLLDTGPDDNSTATGINAQRQVVGYFVADDGSLHAFVWDSSNGMRDLNDFKGSYPNVIALADDINDAGAITGRATRSGTTRVAIVAYRHITERIEYGKRPARSRSWAGQHSTHAANDAEENRMYDKLPSDRQNVEVRFDNRDWQPATYVDGEFVDEYGMPLDSRKISSWRAPNGSPNRVNAPAAGGRPTSTHLN